MEYSNLCGLKVSKLGFGTMRFPCIDENDGNVDLVKTKEMIDYAIKHGVNYFDTAYMYHECKSEEIIGSMLKDYPRDSYYIADKYPGFMKKGVDPSIVFEEQLKRCGVDYFDFYLLHNFYEFTSDIYENDNPDVIGYLVKQKELGRIKHLGFSCHADVEFLEHILQKYHDVLEFCQIQLNYVDYTLQRANKKIELLNKYNIPIIVMEPVRGGKLANVDERIANLIDKIEPNGSKASVAFRFNLSLSGIAVILSGMSSFEQVKDNINTFSNIKTFTKEEINKLAEVGKQVYKGVPCTACRYCTKVCENQIDIPRLLALYNEHQFAPTSKNVINRIIILPEETYPTKCVSCGKCANVCPQKIEIPKYIDVLKELVK